MKIKITICFILLVIFILGLSSCSKEWLDKKPRQSLVVPATLKDFQGLLDNTTIMNTNHPFLVELGADNYNIPTSFYLTRSIRDQNTYTWAPGDVFQGERVNDWEAPYQQIFYANNVLEGLEKISLNAANISHWNSLKGSALFYRAYANFCLSQIFCSQYQQATASSNLGIPIRLESDVNINPPRASVQMTYDQIVDDLKVAKELLPDNTMYKTRPSKNAAYSMLARVYLSMEQYDSALVYADLSLKMNNILMDYNNDPNINPSTTNTIKLYNPEVIYHCRLGASNMLPASSQGSGAVDSDLYQSFHVDDLRRTIFFQTLSGRLAFRGSYNGDRFFFSGLATDEMYLIRSECLARRGETALALQDLNTLIRKRWKNSVTYVPIVAANANEALIKILTERRKELCFRGIRWSDIRRLNNNPVFAKTLARVVNNQTFTLEPGSNRYIWPIPNNEILYNGIQQNPR